jgi:hypothetical protein
LWREPAKHSRGSSIALQKGNGCAKRKRASIEARFSSGISALLRQTFFQPGVFAGEHILRDLVGLHVVVIEDAAEVHPATGLGAEEIGELDGLRLSLAPQHLGARAGGGSIPLLSFHSFQSTPASERATFGAGTAGNIEPETVTSLTLGPQYAE